MPELSPELHDEIVLLLAPLPQFQREQDRIDELGRHLGDWPGRYDTDWSGGALSFFHRFVERVPGSALDNVLQALGLGEQAKPQIESLRRRIENDSDLIAAEPNRPLARYYQLLVKELSSARWQVDSRFVQLTLLLDQGPEAQGVRFVKDPGRGKYDSLATLLDEIEQQAVVLLGRPGSGKTTLLRRLQLEKTWSALEENREGATNGQTPFFISLNGYRGAAPGEPPPHPYEWLGSEWRLRYPQMPPFEDLFQNGKLLLLLDGLNEMPHRDKTDYRERIGRWQAFLGQSEHSGNSFVFSC
ncbi:MAG: NACHT domain-containing protein, partial [Candidatus Promineifilaceae bacterium]